MKHKVLDLFAGIGGFSLGLERTDGFETVAFCEQDEKAQLVLKKHWPDVPMYGDIRTLTVERLQADGIVPTVITGGFPCQDISGAGKGVGIIGERSSLWSEMFRLIRDVRPAWAIIENVSALRSKGLTLVLQNLCEIGYCAEWHCIPASAVGAPHQRDRIWIVAYPLQQHETERRERPNVTGQGVEGGALSAGSQGDAQWERSLRVAGNSSGDGVADTNSGESQDGGVSVGVGRLVVTEEHIAFAQETSQWKTQPSIPRVVDGFPGRVDRLKQLGNAVVPQIPQVLGSAILSYESIH